LDNNQLKVVNKKNSHKEGLYHVKKRINNCDLVHHMCRPLNYCHEITSKKTFEKLIHNRREIFIAVVSIEVQFSPYWNSIYWDFKLESIINSWIWKYSVSCVAACFVEKMNIVH